MPNLLSGTGRANLELVWRLSEAFCDDVTALLLRCQVRVCAYGGIWGWIALGQDFPVWCQVRYGVNCEGCVCASFPIFWCSNLLKSRSTAEPLVSSLDFESPSRGHE